MTLLFILTGILLLIAGRKLFWFFVGVLGFAVGFTLMSNMTQTDSQVMVYGVSIAAGIAAALLAVFIQKIAVIVVGFAAGGFVLLNFLGEIGWHGHPLPWVLFVVGGIIGAILLTKAFEWALIILSSVTGAIIILWPLHPGAPLNAVLVIMLAIIGLITQGREMMKRKMPVPQHSREKTEPNDTR